MLALKYMLSLAAATVLCLTGVMGQFDQVGEVARSRLLSRSLTSSLSPVGTCFEDTYVGVDDLGHVRDLS